MRADDLARLFYDTVNDEMALAPTRANDVAAREVLADALEERGMAKIAGELRRFPKTIQPRDRTFGSSILREKVRRAIFGPQPQSPYRSRKPHRDVLLADVGRAGGGVRAIDRWFIDSPYGSDYVIEISDGGYGSTTFLVRTYGTAEEAIEVAEEQWPDTFFDEVDASGDDDGDVVGQPHPTREGIWVQPTENHMRVYRARWVARGRIVVDDSGSGYSGRAFVPKRGIVEFR